MTLHLRERVRNAMLGDSLIDALPCCARGFFRTCEHRNFVRADRSITVDLAHEGEREVCLERRSCECYHIVRATYERLIREDCTMPQMPTLAGSELPEIVEMYDTF